MCKWLFFFRMRYHIWTNEKNKFCSIIVLHYMEQIEKVIVQLRTTRKQNLIQVMRKGTYLRSWINEIKNERNECYLTSIVRTSRAFSRDFIFTIMLLIRLSYHCACKAGKKLNDNYNSNKTSLCFSVGHIQV